MTDLKPLIDELDAPDDWDAIVHRFPSRSLPELATPRAGRSEPVRRSIAALVSIGVAAFAIVFLVRAFDTAPRPLTSEPTETDAPDGFDVGERARSSPPFVPPTSLEGGLVVLPLVFPDGSTAELTYPADVRLAELGVFPNILANHPGDCGSDPIITRAGQHGEIYDGDAPLATFDGLTGPVELWEGAAGWQPLYLVFRFGPWWFHMPCQGPRSFVEETGAQWAQRLSGRVTETGFLVLSAEPPLELVGPDSGPLFGPELFLDGGRDAPGFVILALGRACPVGADEDREPGYASRCSEVGDGALQITVQVGVGPEPVTEEGREFVRSVIEGVRVRSLDLA
jgi:hypothetical protein